MAFTLKVEEEKTVINKTETLTAEMCGYDVILHSSSNGGANLSVYPVDSKNTSRLGLIQCNPRSVADIEKFAKVAENLFTEIARHLREAGKDDLRTEFEKLSDNVSGKLDTIFKR